MQRLASFNDRLNLGKKSGQTSTIRKRLSLPGGIAEVVQTPSAAAVLRDIQASYLKPTLSLALPLWQIKPLAVLYVIDDAVDGQCKLANGTLRWYPGRVTAVNTNGTYSVQYLDGDIHTNKESHELRLSKNVKLSSARSSRTSMSSTDGSTQRDHITTMYNNNMNSNNNINNNNNNNSFSTVTNSMTNSFTNSAINSNNNIHSNNNSFTTIHSNQTELSPSIIKSPFKNNSITMRKRSFRCESSNISASRLIGVVEQSETPPFSVPGDLSDVESMSKIVDHMSTLAFPDTPPFPFELINGIQCNDVAVNNDNINDDNISINNVNNNNVNNDNINDGDINNDIINNDKIHNADMNDMNVINDNNNNDNNNNNVNNDVSIQSTMTIQKHLQRELNIKLESELNLLLNESNIQKDINSVELDPKYCEVEETNKSKKLAIDIDFQKEEDVTKIIERTNEYDVELKDDCDFLNERIKEKIGSVERERERGGGESVQSESAKSNFSDISVRSPDSNQSDKQTFEIPSVFDTPRREMRIDGKIF